ncbi:MAG TPA: chalcone isomerase family protein [Thermoanaerobaculia bacterium]|nr:chalcone isomerase family protein [Thermoanaerobaculia bacterium]
MKTRAAVLLVLFFAAAAALVSGKEVAGVTMPDSVTVAGKTLKLNGMGLRKKLMFKVYVAGLYVETPTNAAEAIVTSDQVKRMDLHVLRNLKASQVTEAIEEGFEKNSKSRMAALSDRLKKFSSFFSDVAEGDQISMAYVPGKGTTVSIKGAEKGTVEGKDFSDALFSVWLGPSPVQEDLKKGLVGG